MIYLKLVLVFALLFGLMNLYLKVADRYNVIDKPNERSSHTEHTIRGGGIIFPIAMLLAFLFSGFEYAWFTIGLLLISVISFLDDLKPRDFKVRFFIHLLSVLFLFFQLKLFQFDWYVLLLALFFVIGSINAINFMDGINGITGGYALLTLLTLLYIDIFSVAFIDHMFIIVAIISVIVFNFFNFRKKAKCFAGDVGSVSIAFILLFFLIKLMVVSNNVSYILLLLIYGLDVVTTMSFRMLRKENIFEAHRTHFYQFLANEKKIPHLKVALGYCLVQFAVNLGIICFPIDKLSYLVPILIITGTLIVLLRLITQGFKKLIGHIDID
ncbi:UDP-GlcNAc--UDP-phosphate GlcNAc-1-phosphate transferase [Pedobacter sp. AW1-32]|uniref:UDP-GlcNAc--UDP-phosphate GlcNAc-1-phosphate transferase n=1 Tax=Pedobacter sp. AW1-32 TaxID=3383026 RepID=UPI003FF04080